MPNRIIKESIRESRSIDLLSDKAEILFYRLITYADDFGLFKSDPVLVNRALFPRKNYKNEQVSDWLDEVSETGMIIFYAGSDGEPYGFFSNWDKHQQQRAKRPKYPTPDEKIGEYFKSIKDLMGEIIPNGNHMISDDVICHRNPIQSNPIRESNPNSRESEKLKIKNPDAISLTQFLYDLIKKNNPNARNPNLNSWAEEMDRIIRIDGRDPEDIRKVIAWCQTDSFWRGNILSVTKLRKQYDQLWIKMKSKTKSNRFNNNISESEAFINGQ